MEEDSKPSTQEGKIQDGDNHLNLKVINWRW